MRILVVEDEKKVASFLERGLREEGYAVDGAHDGDDGLMKALVYDYDLLLLDVVLPGPLGARSRDLGRAARSASAVSLQSPPGRQA
jgi:DNA-binding response OmpR family regulator